MHTFGPHRDPFNSHLGHVRLAHYFHKTFLWRWSIAVSGDFPAARMTTWFGLYLAMRGRMLMISDRPNPVLFDWLRAFDVFPRFLDRESPYFDHGKMSQYLSDENPHTGFAVCTWKYLFDRILRSGDFGYVFLSRFYVVGAPYTRFVRQIKTSRLEWVREAIPEGLTVEAPTPWAEDGLGFVNPYASGRHALVLNRHRHDLLNALCSIHRLKSPQHLDLEMCDWLYAASEIGFLYRLDRYLKVQREADALAEELSDPRRGTT